MDSAAAGFDKVGSQGWFGCWTLRLSCSSLMPPRLLWRRWNTCCMRSSCDVRLLKVHSHHSFVLQGRAICCNSYIVIVILYHCLFSRGTLEHSRRIQWKLKSYCLPVAVAIEYGIMRFSPKLTMLFQGFFHVYSMDYSFQDVDCCMVPPLIHQQSKCSYLSWSSRFLRGTFQTPFSRARQAGLGKRINMIMQTVFFKLSQVLRA